MKKLRLKYRNLIYVIFSFLFLIFISKSILSNPISFVIEGNNFTDSDAILSLLDNIPQEINQESSNEIIKALNDSNLFSSVSVNFINNKYIITVKEFPNIT